MKRTVFSAVLIVSLLFINLPAQVSSQKQNLLDVMSSTPPISVTIGGEFIVTGTFISYRGERLDQFITRIYNEARNNIPFPVSDEKLFIRMISESENYALRGITLKRKDGSEQNIDLLRFRLTGNFENNPYLRNDDVIIFPKLDLEYNFVEIKGAVNKSTKFQFVDDDKLSDALFFARGINKAYENINTAIISRLSYDGMSENIIEVNIDEDIELKRGDRIRIFADQTKRKDYKVLVLGEVNNPGEVYITKDNTTLKEVINKAGGLTSRASLKDAELVRNFTRNQILLKNALEIKAKDDPSVLLTNKEEENNLWQVLEMLRMYRAAKLEDDDTLFFNISNQLRILEGINVIDFSELDSSNSVANNFYVKDGDLILIPEKFDAVYVFGQVGKAGYYPYLEGKNYQHYIDMAGGLTITAKSDDEIFLIKAKSREWVSVFDSENKIEPGDFIYVLKEMPRDTWFYISRIATVAGIIGSIATIVLLFK